MRNWQVKNGRYDTDHNGGASGWYIIACVQQPLDFIVLGSYSTEDEDCCYGYDKVKWHSHLQDEAVRLAEEKELTPDQTTLSIVGDSFDGCVLWGAKE